MSVPKKREGRPRCPQPNVQWNISVLQALRNGIKSCRSWRSLGREFHQAGARVCFRTARSLSGQRTPERSLRDMPRAMVLLTPALKINTKTLNLIWCWYWCKWQNTCVHVVEGALVWILVWILAGAFWTCNFYMNLKGE